MNRTFKKINKYSLCFWSRTTVKLSPLTLSMGRRGGRSDHVGVSEHVLVAAGRELLRPVDDGGFEEATTTQVEEGHQVPHDAQIVWILSQGDGLSKFSLVVRQTRPLCCGQSQEGNLVELQQQDQAGPAGVIKGHQEDAEQPGGAVDEARDDAQQSLLLITQHTANRPVHETTVEHPGAHQQEGEQEEDEEVMVPRTDAAVGPDGVVVLLCHTGIAGEAVACPHWFLYHARSAEYSGVQTAGLGQHQHIHFLLFFSCLDEARVGPAGAEVVVEQSGGVESEQNLNCGAVSIWQEPEAPGDEHPED